MVNHKMPSEKKKAARIFCKVIEVLMDLAGILTQAKLRLSLIRLERLIKKYD